MNKRNRLILVLAALFLVGAAAPSANKAVSGKNPGPNTGRAPSLSIHGFRIGMSMRLVEQRLRKRKIKDYKTVFSDLFEYNPSPGTSIKLLFVCGTRGQILGRIELSTAFTGEETEAALPKFKENLIARYGTPLMGDAPGNMLDFCWGECGQGSTGTKLEAGMRHVQEDAWKLALVLGNDGLIEKCRSARRARINQWLNRWIDDVQKFEPGISLSRASKLYQKRYQGRLVPEEERDDAVPQHNVTHFVAKDLDFFGDLGYQSIAFEGEGPGSVVLKFTGTQADGKSKLNERLYYASFTTTAFTETHIFSDLRQKLARFVSVQGKPVEIFPLTDGVMAWWQQGAKNVVATIFDSGLILFEQFDPSLKEAYRKAAAKELEDFKNYRFDKMVF